MAKRIVALTADLMFASNIEATLRREGYDVTSLEDLTSFERELGLAETALVILDLHAGIPPADVVAVCRAAVPTVGSGVQPSPVPVLAFGRHTEPELLRAARAAGCVEAVARSTFVEEMPDLVARVIGG
jgi:DNA-binding response OmpR family regulator